MTQIDRVESITTWAARQLTGTAPPVDLSSLAVV
jgi:hypothetical protein